MLASGACALVALSAAAAAASAPRTPVQWMDSGIAAGLAQRSVHYEVLESPGTGAVGRTVCDAGRTRGIQRITFSRGGRTGHVVIIVVPGVTFLRGDAFALNSYIGFREAPSAKYAGRWIRILPGDRYYRGVSAAVTLRSELDLSSLVNANGIRHTTIKGERVVGVVGGDSFGILTNATFYFRARGLPLPVMKVSKSTSGAVFTTVFDHWNERVRFTLPRSAVDIGRTGLE